MYAIVRTLELAIKFFKRSPKELQSDNGFEFSNKARRKPNGKRTRSYDNILEKFLKEHGIKHRFIRPRTPQHNGKVERSHRTDQDKFYSHLSFYSLEDLRKQGRVWNKRYNEMPKFVLRFKSPNEIELEKLKELSNIII